MKPRMSVARCCCGAVAPSPPAQKLLVEWTDWNWDETNLSWVEAYAASRGVLGRFDFEALPVTDPNWPGNVFMRRNAAGSCDLSSLGISSGQSITSAVVTLQQGNGIGGSVQNYIGDVDIQDEDNPPSVYSYTAQQINLWAAAAGGPIFYSLTPAYGDQVDIDVTAMVQNVINRPGFVGQNLNIRVTTRTSQPINGPNSGGFGAQIAAITQDPEDSYLTITL